MLRRTLATASKAAHDIKAGIILKRPPVLLRTPTDYETAHHTYTSALHHQTRAPYNQAYFEAERMNRSTRDSAEAAGIAYAARTCPEVDRDQSRVDRLLDRTLFLVVRKPRHDHAWAFPQGHVVEDESLREAAERELTEECGEGMRVWFVGQAPVAFFKYQYPKSAEGCTVFFLKSHLLSGAVRVDGKEVVEHKWLTKEELSQFVSAEYFAAVKDALTDH